MATKFYSEANVNNTRKMTFRFINTDVNSRNNDAMTDSSKFVRFV